MQIAGLQKFTMVDFPGQVAATVFTRGCTFACGFCHNPELVLPKKFIPLLDEEKVLNFFEKRVGQLQAVCITGGEPTLQPDLILFIQKLKKLGYKIKLDTNGFFSEILEKIIQSNLVNYIAMDVKSSLPKYAMTTGCHSGHPICHSEPVRQTQDKLREESQKDCHSGLDPESSILTQKINKSIKLIMQSGIDYEFRTTVCRPIHEVSDFDQIGKLIKGAKRYFIQNFVQSKHIDEHQKFRPFSDEKLAEAKKIMKKYVKKIEIR